MDDTVGGGREQKVRARNKHGPPLDFTRRSQRRGSGNMISVSKHAMY